MVSVQHGGDHERRRRAGTENVPGIVGFGKAVESAAGHMAEEAVRVTALRDRLWEGVRSPGAGRPAQRPPHASGCPGPRTSCFRGVESESIVLGLDLKGIGGIGGLGVHLGQRGAVVRDGGHGRAARRGRMGAVRLSLGSVTTAEDIDYVMESASRRAQAAGGDAAGAA